MLGFVDTRRGVLRIEGADARDWLQGLVTNDVRRLAPDAAVYAALLTPQGKYLFDFVLVEAADGAVLADVAAERLPALAQRLAMYRLRRDVRLLDVSADTGVALVWGGRPAAPGALCVADPRAPTLGWRLYAQDAGAALASAGVRPATRRDYDALRIAALAPETGMELTPDETFVLEAGFDRLNGVDFRKGCYVGQEVTARMRHKTELRKGLVRVRVAGAAPPSPTPLRADDGRDAGMLYTVVDGEGLAHVRLDRATAPMRAGDAVVTLAG